MARKRKIPEPSRNGHKPPDDIRLLGLIRQAAEDPQQAARDAGSLLGAAGVGPQTVEAFVQPLDGSDRQELFVRLLDHIPEPGKEG